MRVLAPLFVLCAGMASAAPDCEEPAQAHELVAYEPSAELDVLLEEDTSPAPPKRELTVSLRPRLRPCKFRQIEVGRERMRDRGAVCGDWTIVGEAQKSFRGKYRGCGIVEPVRIRMVSDVFLSQFALMDCETAVTLKTWLENSAKPAFADQGGGLKGLRLSGHYACKTQNNQPRARISEHARGRAIDISSFILTDGTVITVRDGWTAEDTSDVIHELHAGACGLFGTVLGPDADRYHKGHFHFDTARRRSGPVCR
ncbi:extensin family protein [Ruegeria sp. AU67]|uniref:extensin-like domain-containing protein n=1 Tax=Ruegeria sp. AU67 TaxID=2108530 RepID=UPI000D68ECE4|nr:extensin family protein [Ruegeria sp. AU67]